MKRDVMQNAGLEIFAELGIWIFFITFLVVAAKTFLTGKDRYEEAAELPLEDGVEVSQ